MKRGPGPRCECAHGADMHATDPLRGPGGGRCLVELPAFIEEELPPWACPCREYSPGAAGPWRWHAGTSSWQAAAS